ncbi:MAG: hypothetical protein IKG96_03630 [Bacteroidaceae bacterium]|nr:hypothetical protein [Bacteroidaceae bacterium]
MAQNYYFVTLQRTVCALLLTLLCATGMWAQTDVTSSILNSSFDGRGLGGWRNTGFQTQTNSQFSGKTNYAYAEKWVTSGSKLPDGYFLQTLSGLTNGQYTLTVNAHCIQQSTNASGQTGAYLVGNENQTTIDTYNTYSVTFYVVDGTAEIGIKLESCTGNWIAFDNFQLVRNNTGVTYLRQGLSALVTKANTLASKNMTASVKTALNSAISTANNYTSNGSETNVKSAYAALKTAVKNAENSIYAYGKTEGTGITVTTDTRYEVGTTMAFARATFSGSNIATTGFVYSSTNTTPTLEDNRTTYYMTNYNHGNIYVLDNMTPGSTYYIRPFALTTANKVSYGDVLRIYTHPRSTSLTYNFNASGDTEIDARLKNSMDAFIGYWNACTAITVYKPTANYSAGTPTADCSYGGWIRFGSNVANQLCGTALHELMHGIGVGTDIAYQQHMEVPNNNPGSSYGQWLGKRATKLTHFYDDNENEWITGGGAHVWATASSFDYTINGAHTDTFTDLQYYCAALLAQAMCEDGMCPVANLSFMPCYSFTHEDNTRYYIRNSNKNYGLNTSTYLYASGTTLKWKTYASDAAAQADDAAAWYIDFDPATQYYYFKNVSTGKYLYSSGSSFNVSGTAKNSNTQIHLHQGWWNATFGSGTAQVTKEVFYLMHPAETAHPVSLKAAASGSLTTEAYWPYEDRSACRWMIIKADEMSAIENAAVLTARNNVLDIIDKVRTMAATTHTDNTGSANTTLASTLSTIEAAVPTATTSECATYYDQVISACQTFMQNTTPAASGYDITFLVADAGFDTGDGWTGSPTLNYSVGEKFETTFDIYQTLLNMPSGRYVMKMQAYERPGSSADVYTAYKSGTDAVTAQIYINSVAENIVNISKGAQSAKRGVGDESEVSYNDATAYIPNNMQAGANYFSGNLYDNSVEITEFSGGTLQFGIRNTTSVTADWTLFDNVRLYYFGGQTNSQDPAATCGGYDITNAMAPYLSTYSQKDWTISNIGMSGGGSSDHTNGDASTIRPYFESWVASTGSLSNSSAEQTITELPNGTYYIGGSFIATRQSDASLTVTGTTFYAGDQSVEISTANGVPERYSLRVTVTDGTLTYGVRTVSTNANWIAFDNFFLIYDGTEDEYLSNASSSTPVRIVLKNPRMEDDLNDWTLTNVTTSGDGVWKNNNTDNYANINGRFMEAWIQAPSTLANKSAMQTVTLREGNYTLKAAVNATLQSNTSLEVSGVSLKFDTNSVACHTGNGAPEIYQVGSKVTAGDYEFGLDVTNTDANWVAWDNIVLYYYGNDESTYNVGEPEISVADNSYIQNLTTVTFKYNDAGTSDGTAAFALLNSAAKATLKKGTTTVAQGTLSLNGKTVTATFSGVSLDAASDYTLTLPADVVGFSGHLANAAVSLTLHTPVLFDTTCYLLNSSAQKYLSRNGVWNTQAVADDYGLAVQIVTPADGNTRLRLFDNLLYVYDDGNSIFADGGENVAVQFTPVQVSGNQYRFQKKDNTGYLGISGDAIVTNAAADATSLWTLQPTADHVANYATLANAQVAAAATAASLTGVTTVAGLEAKIGTDFLTDEIAVTGAKEEKFQVYAPTVGEGTDADYYTETVTDLTPGLYRVSVDAFQRAAYNEWVAAADGGRGLIMLFANDAQTQIKSVMDYGASSAYANDYANGGLHYPNDEPSAYVALETGNYQNVAYVYVPADAGETTGTLTFGIRILNRMGNGVSTGTWCAYENFKLEYLMPVVTLDETAATPPTTASNVAVRFVRNIIANTNAESGNAWNTICFPFDLTAEQISTFFGAQAVVKQLNEVKTNGNGGAQLYFEAVTDIVANTPYIMQTAQAATEYLIKGIDVKPSENLTVTVGGVEFVGNYVYPLVMANTGGTDYYILNDVFKSSTGRTKIKGYRAYFHVPAASGIKALGFRPDEATGIEETSVTDALEGAEVYDLCGRRVARPSKGFYIVNGKKILIR